MDTALESTNRISLWTKVLEAHGFPGSGVFCAPLQGSNLRMYLGHTKESRKGIVARQARYPHPMGRVAVCHGRKDGDAHLC